MIDYAKIKATRICPACGGEVFGDFNPLTWISTLKCLDPDCLFEIEAEGYLAQIRFQGKIFSYDEFERYLKLRSFE